METTNNTLKAIIAKLELMQEYLARLLPLLAPADTDIVNNSTVLSAIERNFQLIVDAAIDINTAIISKSKAQPSDDYQGTFIIVAKCGAIPDELAYTIAPSVGLRNALVHVYEKLNPAKVVHDIKRNIGQYQEYMTHILKYIEKEGENQ